jgi:hypothetical protein
MNEGNPAKSLPARPFMGKARGWRHSLCNLSGAPFEREETALND